MSGETVFITGATGYIAQHIIKQLLSKGYSVIGSVRSHTKGEQLKELITAHHQDSTGTAKFDYVIVESLTSFGAFDSILQNHKEISIFIHTASPIPFPTDNIERDILNPAIDGTKNVLQSIKKYGNDNIKRVVITSSIAAIKPFGDEQTELKIILEKDWNPITFEQGLDNPIIAYYASKTLAEREVWKFIDEQNGNDNQINFKLAVVNPLFVFGPQAFGIKDKSAVLRSSAEIVNSILKLKSNDSIPSFVASFIDARDVAKAHILAFENNNTIGQRLLLNNEIFTKELIAHLIKKNFPSLDIPEGDVVKSEEQIANYPWRVDSTKTEKILGFEYIPLEKSIIDTVNQLI